jgi:hypothetical protein
MHYDYGPGKINNERPTFWEIMLLLTLKRQYLVKKNICLKTAKYCLDPEPVRELEPGPEVRTGTGAATGTQNLYKVGAGTNHYGSTKCR